MFVRITQRVPAPNRIASDNGDPSQHCKDSSLFWKEVAENSNNALADLLDQRPCIAASVETILPPPGDKCSGNATVNDAAVRLPLRLR
jgi:hypothetical protein